MVKLFLTHTKRKQIVQLISYWEIKQELRWKLSDVWFFYSSFEFIVFKLHQWSTICQIQWYPLNLVSALWLDLVQKGDVSQLLLVPLGFCCRSRHWAKVHEFFSIPSGEIFLILMSEWGQNRESNEHLPSPGTVPGTGRLLLLLPLSMAMWASCCWYLNISSHSPSLTFDVSYHCASAALPGTSPVVPGTGRLLFFLPLIRAMWASCCWYLR